MIIDRETVWNGQSRCLWKPKSIIEIAGMQYEVRYTIKTDKEEEKRYVAERNEYLLEQGMALPQAAITAIPHPRDFYAEWAVYRHGIGSGGNGSLYEGVDPMNGGLRAIKEVIVKHEGCKRAVQNEIDAYQAMDNVPGIVRVFGSSSTTRDIDLEFKSFPGKTLFFFEKGVSFDHVSKEVWQSIPWLGRMDLFGQLLCGLAEMHKRGWMHRDITPQNILLFPSENRAAFCDLGKAILANTHTSTNIANWYYLPPELEEGKNHVYGHQLDVYMLAFVLILTWWKPALRPYHRKTDLNHRVAEDHLAMTSYLKREKDSRFADLVVSMLTRDPRFRPNEHQVFTELRQRLSKTEPPKTLEQKRLGDNQRKCGGKNKRFGQ